MVDAAVDFLIHKDLGAAAQYFNRTGRAIFNRRQVTNAVFTFMSRKEQQRHMIDLTIREEDHDHAEPVPGSIPACHLADDSSLTPTSMPSAPMLAAPSTPSPPPSPPAPASFTAFCLASTSPAPAPILKLRQPQGYRHQHRLRPTEEAGRSHPATPHVCRIRRRLPPPHGGPCGSHCNFFRMNMRDDNLVVIKIYYFRFYSMT